ncbi:MAG: 5-formyltetrahydrofolate cyclo-ligase [Sulfurospirillum sp.]|nr:MAG: 5-formyltetrahydrofolate cyclo-ligase [Sulfurospirillum sp.]
MAKLRRHEERLPYMNDKKAALRIEAIIDAKKPRSLLFYMPMPIEVDLRNLMQKMRKRYKIFVPFIVKESFKMVNYRLPLRRNSYKIYEPPQSRLKIKDVDMIIVPVVGVDGACKRVGFGKGMYDRYFQKLKKRPVVVFVQRVKCATHEIVTDDYDIMADFYVTPKETLYRGRNYDNRNRTRSGRRCRRCRRYRADHKQST